MTQAQYQVPPINRALVRDIIKQELGNYPEKIFKSFDTQAIAAASIGQVHRATLEDGTAVAVKIQYPNVRNTIDSDLLMVRSLIKRMVKGEIDEYFEEVREKLLEETDYLHEGEQMERFRKRFSNHDIHIPQWYDQLSTQRVLTMEFLEGQHLGEFVKTNPTQEERNTYGQLLWDFFHHQIEHYYDIHADAHPGNFLFMRSHQLGVIDFGCVKSFPKQFFYNYLRLLPVHLQDDEQAIIDLYKTLDILKTDPQKDPKEKELYEFSRKFSAAYAEPYRGDTFDFGDPAFQKSLNAYIENAPVMLETRGSKHFIYGTRTHIGLYQLLIKMKAKIDTSEAKRIVYSRIQEWQDQFD
jgi:predicted unusual protein kinase regulating ubiquinone biosynthesis (AarF/ABC1/UbiB family)